MGGLALETWLTQGLSQEHDCHVWQGAPGQQRELRLLQGSLSEGQGWCVALSKPCLLQGIL